MEAVPGKAQPGAARTGWASSMVGRRPVFDDELGVRG